MATETLQGAQLALGLNPFGHDGGVVGVEPEGEHGGAEGPPRRVGVDAPGERNVELDDVGPEIENVAEARESRSGIVDGESEAVRSHFRDGLTEEVVIVDAGVFCQLQHDTFGGDLRHGGTELGGHDRGR